MRNIFFSIFALILVLTPLSLRASPLLRGYPDENLELPKSLKHFEFVKHMPGGSGGVSVIKDDSTQQLYTLKCSIKHDAFKEEVLTDALYRSLGVPVPDFALFNHVPTRLIPNSPLCMGSRLFRISTYIDKDPTLKRTQIRNELRKNFVADALLSNWDIVEGKYFKNVILDKQGKLWRIDNGGGLRYRALGTPKKIEDTWSPTWVIDLFSMRSPTTNPKGATVYKDMSPEALEQQAKDILLKADVFFKTFDFMANLLSLNEASTLRNNLISRFQDLHDRVAQNIEPGEVRVADRLARAKPHFTIANTFIYTRHEGKVYVLLGYNTKVNFWETLGGMSDEDDIFITDTAQIDVASATNRHILLSEDDLAKAPSHDFETGRWLLRTYYIPHYYIPESVLKENKTHMAIDRYKWMPVEDLLKGLVNHKNFIQHATGEWKSQITDGKETYVLSPTVFNALRQRPSLALIQGILNGETLPLRRTLTKQADLSIKPKGYKTIPTAKGLKVEWGLDDLSMLRSTKQAGKEPAFQLKLKDPIIERKQLIDAILIKSNAMSLLKGRQHPVLSSSEKAANDTLRHLPLSQSEAHLKSIMGDDFVSNPPLGPRSFQKPMWAAKQNIDRFFKKHSKLCNEACLNPRDSFASTLSKVYATELENKDSYVFYHGTHPFIGFIFDLYTEFRKQLMVLGQDQHLALRGNNLGFNRFKNADDFYAIFAPHQKHGKLLNYAEIGLMNYRDFGLSVNPFLFGSDGRASSASYALFYEGSTIAPPEDDELFRALTNPLGVHFDFHKYIELYNNYIENPEFNTTISKIVDDRISQPGGQWENGRLFQIFIHPSILDDVGYLSFRGGKKMIFNDPDNPATPLNKLSTVLSGIRSNPDFFDDALELLDTTDLKDNEIPDINTLQARLFLDPKYFFDPRYVTIKSYYRHPLRPTFEKKFKDSLASFVRQDLGRWLAKNVPTVPGAFSTYTPATGDVTQSTSQPTLQRLYTKVVEGVTQEKPVITFPSLLTILQSRDNTLLKSYLLSHPGINLNRRIYDEDTSTWIYPLEIALEPTPQVTVYTLLEFGASFHIYFRKGAANRDTNIDKVRDYVKKLVMSLSTEDPQLKLKLNVLIRDLLSHTATELLPFEKDIISLPKYLEALLVHRSSIDLFTMLFNHTNRDPGLTHHAQDLTEMMINLCIKENQSQHLDSILKITSFPIKRDYLINAIALESYDILKVIKDHDPDQFYSFANDGLTLLKATQNYKRLNQFLELFKDRRDLFETMKTTILSFYLRNMESEGFLDFEAKFKFPAGFTADAIEEFGADMVRIYNKLPTLAHSPDVLVILLRIAAVSTDRLRDLVENIKIMSRIQSQHPHLKQGEEIVLKLYKILLDGKHIGPETDIRLDNDLLNKINAIKS